VKRLTLIYFLLAGTLLPAAEIDLNGYRTVDQAIKATTGLERNTPKTRTPYLGISWTAQSPNGLQVEEVAIDSPAEKGGIRSGDVIAKSGPKEFKDRKSFEDWLQTKYSGETISLTCVRQKQNVTLPIVLVPLSLPMPVGRQQAYLGIQVTNATSGEGVQIQQIVPGSPADLARLQVGEVVLKVDSTDVSTAEKLREALAAKKPDDPVSLTLLLAQKRVELKLKLGSESVGNGSRDGRNWNSRGYWTKPAYRIAIINVEYPDTKHNTKIPAQAWHEAMFSQGGKYKTTATGQAAHGSMYDYYFEQSYGQLKIEGKSFEPVEITKKRSEYYTGSRDAFFKDTMDKLLQREGKDALKDFDGVFFIYAGERYPGAARMSLYWPHRSNFTYEGKRWSYFICPEGGRRMQDISVFCHEFGHMLGLPDLYARPENPGMEGVGVWCAMANQAGGGKPQHFSAWSKEKLAWVKPTTIDPRIPQKLILSPIEDSPKECFKILARPDGSEHFLLENRRKKGFDTSLPAEGLLIWRVVGNRPILEESHGVDGPNGPRTYLGSVPYPSSANDSFTPFTIPSSRSQLGEGSWPVYITNIQRLPDGRISFEVGYEYQ
jgi:M6 family metalloprotease-like protein